MVTIQNTEFANLYGNLVLHYKYEILIKCSVSETALRFAVETGLLEMMIGGEYRFQTQAAHQIGRAHV